MTRIKHRPSRESYSRHSTHSWLLLPQVGFASLSEFEHAPIEKLSVAVDAHVLEHRLDIGFDEIVPALFAVDLDFEPLVEIDEPVAARQPDGLGSRFGRNADCISGCDFRRDSQRMNGLLLGVGPVDPFHVFWNSRE